MDSFNCFSESNYFIHWLADIYAWVGCGFVSCCSKRPGQGEYKASTPSGHWSPTGNGETVWAGETEGCGGEMEVWRAGEHL